MVCCLRLVWSMVKFADHPFAEAEVNANGSRLPTCFRLDTTFTPIRAKHDLPDRPCCAARTLRLCRSSTSNSSRERKALPTRLFSSSAVFHSSASSFRTRCTRYRTTTGRPSHHRRRSPSCWQPRWWKHNRRRQPRRRKVHHRCPNSNPRRANHISRNDVLARVEWKNTGGQRQDAEHHGRSTKSRTKLCHIFWVRLFKRSSVQLVNQLRIQLIECSRYWRSSAKYRPSYYGKHRQCCARRGWQSYVSSIRSYADRSSRCSSL